MANKLCMGCMELYDDKYSVCPHCGYIDDTPAKEAYHLKPGTILNGCYIVGKVIGYGGFGVTYLGYNMVFEQKVAIKEYLPSEFATRCTGDEKVTIFSGDKEEQFAAGIIKFIEEAKKLAKFKDVPGIVSISDSFMANNTAYIVMEYLEGETLKEKINKEGKLPFDTAVALMDPVLNALMEVHKEGIIHRDISPDNIFVTDSGEVKLLDFGAARFATTSHSRSLSVIIKPGYAPEEQYRSRGDQGSWTDVYACAATLYKLITGVTPEDSMERKEKDTLVFPSKLGIKISKNAEISIMNALNLRVEDRTQTIEEFKNELNSTTEVRRRKNKKNKTDIGGWPLWLKIVSGVAAAAVILSIVLILTGVIEVKGIMANQVTSLAEGNVYVPNVINYALDEAEKIASEKTLLIQIMDKRNSEIIPSDYVLAQNLAEGMVVEEGAVLELVVSAGKEIVYMINFEGMSEDDVIRMAEEMGLVIEKEEEASELPKGYVIKQEIPEGEAVEKGSTIKIIVSSGDDAYDENAETEVPNVVGKTWETAKIEIQNAKLYIYKTGSEYSDTVPKNQIISQDIAAGSKVNEGTQVGVIVSLGVEKTRVPDVQYLTSENASQKLKNANLKVSVKYEDSDTVAKDHVIRQSVAAGTEVDKNTSVTIWISNGNKALEEANKPQNQDNNQNATQNSTQNSTQSSTQNTSQNTTQSSNGDNQEVSKVSVPDLYGKTEAEAKTALTNAGLNVGSLTYQYDENGANGKVISQSTKAGTKVDKGTVVSFTVCNNPDEGKIVVPNLVGMSESAAKTELTNAKLQAGNITYMHDETKADGTVLSQDITSGVKVAKKTTVNLVVCNNSKKTQYRYRSISEETTTDYSSSLPGWELYDSTQSWGSYGSWSDWSTDYVSSSDSRDVDYKYQYRYRDTTTKTSSSQESGWTVINTATNYGAWSSEKTTTSKPTEGDTLKVTGSSSVTTYYYFHYDNAYTAGGYGIDSVKSGSGIHHNYAYHEYSTTTALNKVNFSDVGGKQAYGSHACPNNWNYWFLKESKTVTTYRYQTRDVSYTYTLQYTSDWSSWSDSYVSSSSTREVQNRTLYRYRTRDLITTYYFKRTIYGDWSSWSDNVATPSEYLDVETRQEYVY